MAKPRSFSELVHELAASADEVASLAKDSEGETEIEFAIYIEKLSLILDTMRDSKVMMDTPRVRSAIGSIEAGLNQARASMIQNRRLNDIQQLTHDLGRSLGLLLFASIGVSMELKQRIRVLRKEMMGSCDDDDDDENGDDGEICIDGDDDGFMGMEIEDVVLQLKYGNDDEFRASIMGLEMLIRDKFVDCEWIVDEGIIPILFNRLGSSKCVDRLSLIKVLRRISLEDDQCKEKMADINSLTTLVKSLARDERERREAVGLLMDLSHVSSVRRRIGRIQGCIIMLVAILNGDDPLASHDAAKLLCSLSSNTQNTLLMAEAGYFQPLIQHLKEGSEMSKILMATALSRMVMTEKTRALLGEGGAIQPLVTMFKTGKLEAKLSALNALRNLSVSTKNISHIVESGVLSPVLQLLFSVTSSLMTLREPASAILATIAQSESILEHKDLPDQLLSLINLSSPKIKVNILKALNSIASHHSASEARSKMTQSGALQLLFPFINESDTQIRTACLNLIHTMSKDSSIEETYLPIIVKIISSSSSDAEKSAAVGLLSNIPVSDKKATDKLKRENLLPILISLMGSLSLSSSSRESVAGIFIRFTIPSDKKLQLYAAELGVIPVLVNLLSNGSIEAKSRAAKSLTQLSQNSLSLIRRPRNSRWGCVPSPTDALCEIHNGHCSIKGNFCLVKAGAVTPLIRVLEGDEREADEPVLSALATLLQDDVWENGCNFIEKISGGVEAIVKVLEVGNVNAKETAMWALERVFRCESNRSRYGGSAQIVLIDLAQKGEPALRPLVAGLLAQLELLQEQSSYF